MAIRRNEPSDNGDVPRWLKKWIGDKEQREHENEQRLREHEERMREHEERMREHEERMREHEERSREHEERMRAIEELSRGIREDIQASNARLSRLEDSVELQKEQVARSRRETRELVAVISRMDTERRRDRVQYARLFKGMLTQLRHLRR